MASLPRALRWFTSLFGQDALDLHEFGLGGPLTGDRPQEAIGHDVGVTDVMPKLFLANLACLTRGPGFPNLSCPGLLFDRVLGATSPTQPPTTNDPSIRRRGEQIARQMANSAID